MAVNQKHPEYERRASQWTRLHDAIEGEDQIKAAGKLYLPMLSGQQEGEYTAYKLRAMFYAATDRTVDGLVGAILRKDGEQVWPDAHEDVLKVVGAAGESWAEIINTTLAETIGAGRYGLLVDAPETEGELPYVAQYVAEAITDWDTAVIGGRLVPISITLQEDGMRYVKGKREAETKYRILRLGPPETIPQPGVYEEPDDDPSAEPQLPFERYLAEVLGVEDSDISTDGMLYWQEVWKKGDKDDQRKGRDWVLEAVTVPRMAGGRALDAIPFVFFNPSSTKAKPEKPPLLDMVNVDISHYRNSADLEHGLHFTALPTPWAAGFDMDELCIGSERAWISEDSGASAGFLEFTGAGLGTLSSQMDKKEKLMAVLGARLLEEEPSVEDTATGVRLRHQGEDSALSRISKAVSEGLTTALRTLAAWLGVTAVEDIHARLNTDFDTSGIDPAFMAQLMLAVQSGMISWATFFHQVKIHEVVPEGVTQEDEEKRILEGSPGSSLEEQIREEEAERTKEMMAHEAQLAAGDDDDPPPPPGKGKQPPPKGGK